MSWHYFRHAVTTSPAKGSAYTVHLILADHADDTGLCWPSVPTLAQECRMSKSAVYAALTDLEALGVVGRIRSPGKRTRYRLFFQAIEGCKYCTLVTRPDSGPVQILETTPPDSGTEPPENPQKDPDPDPRARDVYPPVRGQSGTSPAILPDTVDAPDVEAGDQVGCPPPAAALFEGATQPEGTESVEDGEPPALACQQYGCLFSGQRGRSPSPGVDGEPPPPEQPAVSALPRAETVARPEALAAGLAPPQGGAARETRADGACARAAPPEFGRTYRAAWSDGPPEVGPFKLPVWLLAFPSVRTYGLPQAAAKGYAYG
jgi:Helix-turn-helix domain